MNHNKEHARPLKQALLRGSTAIASFAKLAELPGRSASFFARTASAYEASSQLQWFSRSHTIRERGSIVEQDLLKDVKPFKLLENMEKQSRPECLC